jgi:hypothetical protein
MLTETFHSMATATRNVFRNWQALTLIAIVYACLLAVLYFFVIVREATVVQITLTFASAVVAPALFFVLQAMVANDNESLPALPLLRRSLTGFWKLVLVTLPLIALAVLIVYLLGKAQVRFDASASQAAEALPRRLGSPNARDATPPIEWRHAILSTIRYLCFGLLLPLAAIHLWLATVHEGLVAAIKRIAGLLARAFAPRSVLIYVVGFLVFAVVPYYLLFRTTQTKHAWIELFLLVVRLIIVFALTLFGWLITVRALARFPATSETGPAGEAA